MTAAAFTHADRGAAPVELVLGVSLLMVPLLFVMLALPNWPDATTGATASSKEAATLFVNAPDPETGLARAQEAVARASSNLGHDMSLTDVAGQWGRGCTITISVTVNVAASEVPFYGQIGALSWTATSSARIEDHRDLDPNSGGSPC